MKINKKGVGESNIIKWIIILAVLAAILWVFVPDLQGLLWTDLFGEKCAISNLNQEQSEKQVKDFLQKNMNIEALLAYRDFKDCFKDKTMIFTKDEYEKLIEAELQYDKLDLFSKLELYEQYVNSYLDGKFAAKLMLILSYNRDSKLALHYLELLLQKFSNNPLYEKEVCEAYYLIVPLKKNEKGEQEALSALNTLKTNWDKCVKYPNIFPEGAFIQPKDQFFEEWEANIQGKQTEKQIIAADIESVDAIDDINAQLNKYLELSEKYKNIPESTLISYRIAEIYDTENSDLFDVNKAIEYYKKAYSGQFYKGKFDYNEEALNRLAFLYNEKGEPNTAHQYYSTYIEEYPIGSHADEAVDAIISIAQTNKDISLVNSALERVDKFINSNSFVKGIQQQLTEPLKEKVYARRLKLEQALTGVTNWAITFKGTSNPAGWRWSSSFSKILSSDNYLEKSPGSRYHSGTIFDVIAINTDADGRNIANIKNIDEINLQIPKLNFDKTLRPKNQNGKLETIEFSNGISGSLTITLEYGGFEKNPDGNNYIKYKIYYTLK